MAEKGNHGSKESTSFKINRLKKNYLFRQVYNKGKSLATPRTVLLFKKNEENVNRLGITVSKKVGKSVVRHRVKRLYSEAFRILQGQINYQGFDFVIIARKKASRLTYHEASEDLQKLLKRGKFIS